MTGTAVIMGVVMLQPPLGAPSVPNAAARSRAGVCGVQWRPCSYQQGCFTGVLRVSCRCGVTRSSCIVIAQGAS